jgi:hypothetical protein
VGSCEHGNEPLVCIRGVKFLGQQSSYSFLKKDSAP